MKDSNVEVLQEILDGGSSAATHMNAILIDRAEMVRSSALSEIAKCAQSKDLRAAFNRLQEVHRIRVLSSTEMGDWLATRSDAKVFARDPERGSGTVLLDILEREALIGELLSHASGQILTPGAPGDEIWSPMGDFSARFDGERWELFKSPCIGQVCAVDFHSPLAKRCEPRSGVLSREPLPWDPGEEEQVVAKLDDAISMIDEAVPEYGALIRNFTRRIIVRKTIANVRGAGETSRIIGSEHVTRQPGGIRLLNPQLSEVTLAQCMESLLHESVHNFLAASEMIHGRFTEPGEQYRPISPWSGNPIPNSSFVHATFVYYACNRLFAALLDRADELEEKDVKYVQSHLPRFAAGFLVNRPLSSCLVATRPVDSRILDELDRMQQSMRELYALDRDGKERMVVQKEPAHA